MKIEIDTQEISEIIRSNMIPGERINKKDILNILNNCLSEYSPEMIHTCYEKSWKAKIDKTTFTAPEKNHTLFSDISFVGQLIIPFCLSFKDET